MSGKGSRPRPFSVDKETFDNNWDNIFSKKTKETKIECGSCGWIGTTDEGLLDEDLVDYECPSCGEKL